MNKKSEIIIAIVGIVIVGLIVYIVKVRPASIPQTGTETEQETAPAAVPLSITDQDIKEENFTGTQSVVSGSGVLAESARGYIDDTVASFKLSADQEVPDMRAKFGADSPTANYEIDLKATDTKSDKTESIVIDQYIYTGGANGNSSYKVFTISRASGKLLTLSDIVLPSKQSDFTALVKKELLDWRPEGSTELVVFADAVNDLTFDSFANWSYDGKNLIIYFDKYEIGPGVLGGVAFPVPLPKIKGFLVAGY